MKDDLGVERRQIKRMPDKPRRPEDKKALQEFYQRDERRALELSKGKELLARANVAIAAPSGETTKPTGTLVPPPARQGGERVKLPATCSARGTSYVLIAERREDRLHLIGHELPQVGKDKPAQMPSHLSGRYRIEAANWLCPICSDHRGIWVCDCERMNGAIHCLGTIGGRHHCACGRLEEHEFIGVETTAVRGTAVAEKPMAQNAGFTFLAQQRLKQVPHG